MSRLTDLEMERARLHAEEDLLSEQLAITLRQLLGIIDRRFARASGDREQILTTINAITTQTNRKTRAYLASVTALVDQLEKEDSQ